MFNLSVPQKWARKSRLYVLRLPFVSSCKSKAALPIVIGVALPSSSSGWLRQPMPPQSPFLIAPSHPNPLTLTSIRYLVVDHQGIILGKGFLDPSCWSLRRKCLTSPVAPAHPGHARIHPESHHRPGQNHTALEGE